MPSASLLLACASLAIWLYLAFGRGAFWRVHLFDDDDARHDAPLTWPQVVAVVPARNEAATIAQAVGSLLQQNYPGEFSIIVVDDHSDDGTSRIAQQTAQKAAAESRFSICAAAPLPTGWTGKLWALNEAVKQTSVPTRSGMPPTYYWFTDADIMHAPDTLRRLVARAERNKLDLTSLMVLLQAKTLAERALIPAFLFFFLMLYPPLWIADERKRTAGAAGGCILLRRDALERSGGLAAIRGEVIDDCALAGAIKRGGGRIWMGLTRASISLRGYSSFGEIRDMVARTAFTQLRYSALLLLAAIGALFLTFLAPIAFLFAQHTATRLLALAIWLTMSLLFLPTVRYYRISTHWAAVLPLTAAFYSYATFLSAFRHWLGRGAQWKGRRVSAHIRNLL